MIINILVWLPILNWIIPPYIHWRRSGDFKDGVIWRMPIFHGFISALVNAVTVVAIVRLLR